MINIFIIFRDFIEANESNFSERESQTLKLQVATSDSGFNFDLTKLSSEI